MIQRIFPYTAALLFLVVATTVNFINSRWKTKQILQYDKVGYHHYLPAFFIYHDITKYDYLDSLEKKYPFTNDQVRHYGLIPYGKTGLSCNQYPMGVSLFQAPFFFVAHAWSHITHQDLPDGYTSPYQHAVVMSTLFFAILSLIILTSFLRNFFSDVITFLTVFLIAFGTNFFCYSTTESGLSHVYQFFLYSSVLYITHKWYRSPSWKWSALLGLCIGLAIVTRPIDILICVIPLFWTREDKWIFLKENLKYIVCAVVLTFLACTPQMLYWYHITGQWIYYSYSEVDYFQFNRFRVIHGLFSYRKGWFLYTPLALLAFIQAYRIPKNSVWYGYKKMFWIFFIPMIYLVFSWHNWFYGWSFGCRALVGTLPLLAIPIALLLQRIYQHEWWRKIAWVILFLFITFLNLFQSWQYDHYILHGTLMNEALYWRLFLKTEKPADLDKNYDLQKELDWNTGGW